MIDLNEVSHLDTTCLGLLIAANLRLRRHGGGLNLLEDPAADSAGPVDREARPGVAVVPDGGGCRSRLSRGGE